MKTILFQGDSITDAGRSRQYFHDLGHGYPNLVSGLLGYERPYEFNFQNRGISGNRVTDLIARMKADIMALRPDYMSILIGVNDVWHEFHEVPNGISAEKYEYFYDILLTEVKEALPDLRLMILEPFVLKGAGTEGNYEAAFRPEVEKRAAAARRIAEKHRAVFVPLQEKFDEVSKDKDPAYWLIDGVHPTAHGHALIAHEWRKAFEILES